jgi:hypothetical protein
MGEMAEGALKSSSDWAGQKAHEREKRGGMRDLLRRLQQAGVLKLCRVVLWGELTMRRMFSKIKDRSFLEPLKFDASR